MAIVMTLLQAPQDYGGESAQATVGVGSNGYAWGADEYDVGPDAYDTSYGRTMWDANLSDGFDTGATPTSMDFGPAGATLDVSGADDGALTSTAVSLGTVGEVDLRAVAGYADCDAKWSNVTVRFLKAGSVRETVSVGTLDATPAADGSAREDLVKVVPAAADNDEVIVTGTVRLTCTDHNSLPPPDGLFCQALIYS